MEYTELKITINPNTDEFCEIITAELANINFESFTETETGINAYIKSELFDDKKLNNLYFFNNSENCKINYTINTIQQQNWNKEWENNFNPVFINHNCVIRAPFHEISPKPKYDIIIMPKMSFGTGHHETTSLMIETVLELKLKNKTVLDMGCGTGVLAILCSKLGAKHITAIDNDKWAYENTIENLKVNNIKNCKTYCGDSNLLKNKTFDIILANINKNILLADIKKYTQSLNNKGKLILSGIYKTDFNDINNEANKQNLKFSQMSEKNKWISLTYIKS